MKDSDLLGLALVGVGGYVLYQALTKGAAAVGNAAAAVGSAVATPIAAAWVWATSSSIQDNGNVILPDGSSVPLTGLAVTFDSASQTGRFTYNGTPYVLVSNPSGGPSYDTNGNYHAITLAQFQTSGS